MNGLMMDFPLTLAAIFRHAETVSGRREIVTRLADKSLHRYRYADLTDRARRLAGALRRLGAKPGDRVATLCWNHYQHLEAYFGVPLMGGVLHTLNLRLHPDELAFIVSDADDQVVIVDESLLPLWNIVGPQTRVRNAIVVAGASAGAVPDAYLDYESLVTTAEPLSDLPDPDERAAAAMCYTTGTTGKPKGVLYSHRAVVLHTLGVSLGSCMGICEQDVRRAGRAHVSRQRLGNALFGRDDGRQDCHARTTSRSGQPR